MGGVTSDARYQGASSAKGASVHAGLVPAAGETRRGPAEDTPGRGSFRGESGSLRGRGEAEGAMGRGQAV